jgi:hypothetical protein
MMQFNRLFNYRIFIFFMTLHLTGLSAQNQVSERLYRFEKRSMWVLAGWSVANMAVGITAQSQTSGSSKYFHQMNAGWNIVNAGIAVGGLLRNHYRDVSHYNLEDTYHFRSKWKDALLLNTGMDVAYMAAGWALMERGKSRSSNKEERWYGFGQSLLLQGFFLFGFDAVLLVSMPRVNVKISPIASINGTGLRLSW